MFFGLSTLWVLVALDAVTGLSFFGELDVTGVTDQPGSESKKLPELLVLTLLQSLEAGTVVSLLVSFAMPPSFSDSVMVPRTSGSFSAPSSSESMKKSSVPPLTSVTLIAIGMLAFKPLRLSVRQERCVSGKGDKHKMQPQWYEAFITFVFYRQIVFMQ